MKNKTTAFFAALCLSTTMAYAQQNTLSDVWDFGAAQLDATQYNNHLTEDIINEAPASFKENPMIKEFISIAKSNMDN